MGILIGKVNGYSICNITKVMLKKNDFFEQIEKKDIKIKEKIQTTLNNKGLIFGFKKDKKLKAIYIFESVIENKKRILKFTEKILLEEISKELQDNFEKNISNELMELVSLEDYEEIEWNGNVIVPKTIKLGKYNIPLGSLLFILGIIFGAIINDITIGICMGLGLSCGSAAILREKNDDNTK